MMFMLASLCALLAMPPELPSGSKAIAYAKYATPSAYHNALVTLRRDSGYGLSYGQAGTSAVGGYPLYVVTVGDQRKPAIVLEGVLHGRHEWHSAHYILAFLAQMARRDTDFSRAVLERYCLVAVPIANPYGYWHGTYHNGRGNRTFPGVNLNRQFPLGWADYNTPADYWTNPVYEDYRTDPTVNSYKGPRALSEPEAVLLAKIMRRGNVAMYLAFHVMGTNAYYSATNYGVTIPYGPQTPSPLPQLWRETVNVVDARHAELLGVVNVSPVTDPQYGLSQSYIYADALGIPSCCIEGGMSLSDDYRSDLYIEAMYRAVASLIAL